jgi:aspartate racemase
MEKDFYRERLRDKFGLDVIVPDAEGRKVVHDIIFNELVVGVVSPESKTKLREVIGGVIGDGAQGVILGCTELTMIADEADSSVPLFDTTKIHSEAAVDLALIENTIATAMGCRGT